MTNLSESSFGRRAFIGVAAGTAAAVAVPEAVRASVGIAARSAGPSPADWNALSHHLAGTLVRPGDAHYNADRLLFDPRFDGQRPAGIAYVKSPHDVATCIAFVRRFKIPFSARSGGHSDGGYSGNTGGLIVDVQNFRTVAVSGSTVAVGAGTRLIDFYHALAAKDRAVPGGSCATVGIAGLTLGGGIGVTARAYGLTCDSLEEAQIVTADGSVLNIDGSPRGHGDLFWACRGGGGGNFGVVTSFTFRTTRAPSPCTFHLKFQWSHAARVVAAWQSWAPHGPDALWSNLHLGAQPGGRTPVILVGGTYLGSHADAARQLDRLYGLIGKEALKGATLSLSDPQSYLDVMLHEAGCYRGYQACHLPGSAHGGTLGRVPQLTKSDFFTHPLSSSGIRALLHGVELFQRVRSSNGAAGGIAFDSLGGAVNRVAPGATAFVHRDALFDAQYTTNWPAGTTSAEINNQHAWIRGYWNSMRRYASGQGYQNYIDLEQPNWQHAYYGGNYPRLQQIKRKYDPNRVFNFAQAIQPAGR